MTLKRSTDARSESRLKLEYWTHVEYYPMHIDLRPDAEDYLAGVLRHGCVGMPFIDIILAAA